MFAIIAGCSHSFDSYRQTRFQFRSTFSMERNPLRHIISLVYIPPSVTTSSPPVIACRSDSPLNTAALFIEMTNAVQNNNSSRPVNTGSVPSFRVIVMASMFLHILPGLKSLRGVVFIYYSTHRHRGSVELEHLWPRGDC